MAAMPLWSWSARCSAFLARMLAVLARILHVLQVRHFDVSFWQSVPPLQRHLHPLGTSTMFDEGTEKILRKETEKIWVSDAEVICGKLQRLNVESLKFGWIVEP